VTHTFRRWLERLGLGRKDLLAWAMYDWANSAFITVIITAVYPIFFQRVAAQGLEGSVATGRHALATFWALLTIAVLSPFLGAVADYKAMKKRLLGTFMALGVAATVAMVLIQPGQWLFAATLFVLANIGVTGSFVFYDSLLPHIAGGEEMDRASTAGYALGYLGGGLLLGVCLVVLAAPARFGFSSTLGATRFSFLAVAGWWVVFSVPLFRHVAEPRTETTADELVASLPVVAVRRLRRTFGELRRYRQAFLLLVAVMIYNDGIGTIYRMAAIYGAELGLPDSALIQAILLVQFLGIPFAFLFGALAGRMGTKRAILLGLGVYLGISVLGYYMKTVAHFYLLAVLVATVQGGTQALSRSLFASVVPRFKSSEFFGFFAVFEKFAGTLGPLVFASIIAWTGSSRNAVLAVIAFFLVGGALLLAVDVEEGRRQARVAEAERESAAVAGAPG
jgi:UMF1 family MFS transporter